MKEYYYSIITNGWVEGLLKELLHFYPDVPAVYWKPVQYGNYRIYTTDVYCSVRIYE